MACKAPDDRPFEAPFERSGAGDGDRLLFRSPNFTVRASWETVTLEGKNLPSPVAIGDFYGNPTAAAIDDAEQWCVVVGCGLIAYRLAEPWTPYQYNTTSNQWLEMGRGPKDILWLSEVTAEEDTKFLLAAEGGDGESVREFHLDPAAQLLEPPNWTDQDN